MTTVTVNLRPDLADFLEGEVAKGGYTSSSDVVQDALLLLQHEKAAEEEKLLTLRREIARGLEEAEAGRFSKKTVDDILSDILAGNTSG
ncbi:type II toxin-antitoxin system ParD family antitoxin [Afifella aestuarii]|uniref:type II toxin-antitoxin system ParD family antitoxin n=1 Tax=Afifella aestuarii TaxID=1909496 RepID=UPI000FE3272B|nr:type II toxin-antitoxin system ParD family antitoxin [Afifella aestuarii]